MPYPKSFRALLLIYVCLGSFNLAWAEQWQAGVAKVRITPHSGMPMAGYASRGATHATGTLNDLWAKVLILRDAGGRQAILVTMDVCGIDRDMARRTIDSISAATQVPAEAIILSVSHTHSGPVIAGNLRPMHYLLLDADDQRSVDEFAQQLTEAITQCAAKALANLRPSVLEYGAGEATFAVNRRNNSEAEVPARRQAGELVGPVDHDVPVLVVRQADELVALVFGYACHCTTLSGLQWSSDYAGFAQDELEEKYPGCTAMFWAGCGADQNPIPRGSSELAKDYGNQLASAVEQVLEQKLNTLEAKLETTRKEIELPFASLPSMQQLITDSQSDNIHVASRASFLLKQVQAGEALQPTYPYPIACWKLGSQVEWISLGGEVVVDYALALKTAAENGKVTWIMGYAHDVMAYIPSRRVLAEGGYEGGGAMVYYGLPSTWSPDVEQLILDEVARQRDE